MFLTFSAFLGNIDLAEHWIAKEQVRLFNSKSEFELAYCCFRCARIFKYKYLLYNEVKYAFLKFLYEVCLNRSYVTLFCLLKQFRSEFAWCRTFVDDARLVKCG